jgi:outer membrane scaffolding protein for murein synthesis (MipA/OmpV family)
VGSNRAAVLALVAAAGALATGAARAADPLPLWEAGVGVSGIGLPDYRGSTREQYYVLPFPYFIYRGNILKVDRDGVRAQFLDSKRLTIEVSTGGSIPVKSSNDPARAGMPDLPPTLELGPMVQYNLWASANDDERIDLRMPIRRGIGYKDHHLVDAGTTGSLQVAWDHRLHFASGGGNFGLLAGALFNDRRQSEFYYAVAAPYATATRPAYDPPAGYAGCEAIAAFSRRAGRWWIGAFARYDNLAGATFASSPLVQREQAYGFGAAVAYVFGESAQRVEAEQ